MNLLENAIVISLQRREKHVLIHLCCTALATDISRGFLVTAALLDDKHTVTLRITLIGPFTSLLCLCLSEQMIKQICRAMAFLASLGQLNPRRRRIQTRLLMMIIQFAIWRRNVERLRVYPVVRPLMVAMLFDLVGSKLANHGSEVLRSHAFLQA